MKQSILTAVLIGLCLACAASAQEAKVNVTLQSNRVDRFQYSKVVQGDRARELLTPTPTDLKPFVLEAQKALAVREGYDERIYGSSNHLLLSGVRLQQIQVIDQATGRVAFARSQGNSTAGLLRR